MSFPTEGSVVPPDHHVNVYRPTKGPAVQRTHGGAILANLGSASDEFREELHQIVDEVDRLVSVINRATLLAADVYRLSDLFAPNDVKVNIFHGLLLWIINAESAHLWQRQPELLLAAVRRVGEYRLNTSAITQFAFINIELSHTATFDRIRAKDNPVLTAPPGILELARLLFDAGVPVYAVPQDGAFFLEVCRPDATIGALLTAPLPNVMGARDSSHYVVRAPRLRRLTLAAAEQVSGANASRQLFEELLSREIALLVICDQEGRVRPMSWERFDEMLPVYPDLSSLMQAAKDLGLAPGSFGWVHFSPRDLFTWVNQLPCGGVALNAYKDPTTPTYFFINKFEAKILATGRIPDSR